MQFTDTNVEPCLLAHHALVERRVASLAQTLAQHADTIPVLRRHRLGRQLHDQYASRLRADERDLLVLDRRARRLWASLRRRHAREQILGVLGGRRRDEQHKQVNRIQLLRHDPAAHLRRRLRLCWCPSI